MEIADLAGISEERLSQIVTGRRNPNLEERKAIASVLECKEKEIFDE